MTHISRFVQRIADLETAHSTGQFEGREYDVIQTLLVRAHGKVYPVGGRNVSQSSPGNVSYLVPGEDVAV